MDLGVTSQAGKWRHKEAQRLVPTEHKLGIETETEPWSWAVLLDVLPALPS